MKNKNSNQNFAKEVAECIFSDKSNNSEKYTVYSHVPVNCIYRLENGKEFPIFSKDLYGDTGELRIDAVLCVENEIALCVMLNPNIKLKRLFKGPLSALVFIEPSRYYCTEAFAAYANAALKRYISKNKSAKYKIVSFPVQSLCKTDFHNTQENSSKIRNGLINSRAVDENLNITDYGCACGIMCCYFPSSSDAHKIGISFRTAEKSSDIFDTEKYFKLPLSNDSDCLMPLRQRLMCLKLTIPCEKAYGRLLAEKLNIFLDMPLNEIMKGNKSMLKELYDDIEEAEDFIFATTYSHSMLYGKITLYRDLVNFLYYMNSLIASEKYDNENLKIFFNNILIDLGNFVCSNANKRNSVSISTPESKQKSSNLMQRLAALEGDDDLTASAFSIPLGHYYYAASLLTKSNYPNWLCREKVKKDLHPEFRCYGPSVLNKSLAYTVLDEKTCIFRNSNNDNDVTDKYVSLLYDLLVSPVVDINKIKNLKGG